MPRCTTNMCSVTNLQLSYNLVQRPLEVLACSNIFIVVLMLSSRILLKNGFVKTFKRVYANLKGVGVDSLNICSSTTVFTL